MVFVYMLCWYHHFLIKEGKTTNEDYKKTYRNSQDTPFTRFSYFANLLRTFTRTLSKPLFDKSLLEPQKGGPIVLTIDHDPAIKPAASDPVPKREPQAVAPPPMPPLEVDKPKETQLEENNREDEPHVEIVSES